MDNDEISSMESRHRKEKKELQAQIQALKKAAKNDKTKKKEVAAEILRLESELETRQTRELEALTIQEEDIESDAVIVKETSEPKVSKAQKRRDKKLLQEKEREELIKEQEKENIHGPRNTEIQTISSKLKERNLKIFPIASDGDCLFKAVAHQLLLIKQKTHNTEELRKIVSNYIRQNKGDFLPFMSNSKTFEMLSDTEFDEYCDNITNTKVWGGQLELRAMSNVLKCPISVIQASGPDAIEQGIEFDGPPLIITYHRHMYSLGEHYNSTQPINTDEHDENVE